MQRGIKTRFTTAAAIVHELIEAHDEKRLLRLQRQLASHELLIIDELGFVPLSKTGAELLFEPCLSGYHPHPLYVVCLLGLQARAGAGALRRRSG